MNYFKLILAVLFSLFSLNSFAKNDDVVVGKKYSILVPSTKISNNGFADIVEVLLPAVVNISTSQKMEDKDSEVVDEMLKNIPEGSILEQFRDLLENQKDQDKELSSLGSGFIISEDGYIVTNQHVIDKANKITINLNDTRSFEAKVVGIDKKTDLALLKIDAKESLAYVKMGDSNSIRIGEWVIAVGNPFGLGGSVSVGIVSAHNRDINSGKFDNYIQTDAAINKGNSGGPLFNIKGEVIGIATAIFSPSGGNVGIGFATPTSSIIPVIEQLKKGGEVIRGWLGVSIQDVTTEMADAIGIEKASGAFVVDVVKGGPAKKAGILETDIITKFDGKEIKEMKDLPRIVANTAIDKEVKIEVIRQGEIKVLEATVQKLDDEKLEKAAKQDSETFGKTKADESLLGMGLANLTKEVKDDNKIQENTKGILIVDMAKNSFAKEKGIEKGDIILSVNQTPVSSISDLKKIIKKLEKDQKESIFLFVKREKLIKSSNFIQQKTSTFAVILPLKSDDKKSEDKDSKDKK